ncbi:hypothetical protein RM533_06985 [Croceicoccus sp. F390]|uniref:Uncharacterized protein n=1 Tax=Croceicoccus esteveae TaxID=3075597 RepID=A0ABU2ZKJ3_9SPHN|nr:hypothetical protein [Croceicoccus sp. F390]MDT0575927.1 hypothetical protein [Croceicoccus sp. F390]
MSHLLEVLANKSTRPRYAFMVLNLVADVARPDGSAGPFVPSEQGLLTLRDWLSDALGPMGARDPRRLAMERAVRRSMEQDGKLPDDEQAAGRAVLAQMHQRVRASGKTNLSRAVSELVRADLMRRHYQGYRVDHENRGAQRHAVYTIIGRARCLLRTRPANAGKDTNRQGELPLH